MFKVYLPWVSLHLTPGALTNKVCTFLITMFSFTPVAVLSTEKALSEFLLNEVKNHITSLCGGYVLGKVTPGNWLQ